MEHPNNTLFSLLSSIPSCFPPFLLNSYHGSEGFKRKLSSPKKLFFCPKYTAFAPTSHHSPTYIIMRAKNRFFVFEIFISFSSLFYWTSLPLPHILILCHTRHSPGEQV